MRKKILNEKGFTFIEIIASLFILVIVGALVIISTIKIVQGFVLTKMNAETSQKGHIALNRLTKEFTNIIEVHPASTNATEISFDSRNYSSGVKVTNRHIEKDGDTILIDKIVIVDNVSSFALAYLDTYDDTTIPPPTTWTDSSSVITITLSLQGANGNVSTFNTRVVPRNL